MKLSKAPVDKKVNIIKIKCDNKVKERLAILGVYEGVLVQKIRIAPFNGPIELKVRDFHLAIRYLEAEKIEVEYYE